MSEFSTSFHIRTDAAKAIEETLGEAGYSGVLFGPKNGWLTFVPFADSELYDPALDPRLFGEKLAAATGAFVLQYGYAQDHGWTFEAATPGGPRSYFSYCWDPEGEELKNKLNVPAFEAIFPHSEIEPYLTDAEFENGESVAYGFAQKLGLPAFKWLSPDYVQGDTDTFLNHGGRLLGQKPQPPQALPALPPETKIDVQQNDLSAREAQALLASISGWIEPPWILTQASGHAHATLGKSGNVDWPTDWSFQYLNTETRDQIRSFLFSYGRAGFERMEWRRGDLSNETPLSDDWMDSRTIAEIVKAIEPPQEARDNTRISLLTLQQNDDRVPYWEASMSPPGFDNEDAHHWTLYLHADTGALVLETLSLFEPNGFEMRVVRERVQDGEWRDVGESETG